MTPSAYSIGIAGMGRAAQALGRFLNESGQAIVAIASRDPERTARAARFISTGTTPTTIEEIPAFASHLLIAVSDSAVEHVASLLARSGLERGIALHTCGAKGPQALAVLARQGISCGALHPMQSFASAELGLAALRQSTFAMDGDPEALGWCSSSATLVGGRTLRIREEDRSLYHAAAVMASSYIPALIYGSLEMLEAAGVERSIALRTLAPLARTCIENSLHLGPVEGLTGPIERGDSATVLLHLNSLRDVPTSVKRLYRSARLLVVQRALLRGLPQTKAAEIQTLLRMTQ